jgi:hypothetical protein
LDALRKLAMHLRCDVHASDVTESCDGTPMLPTGDHVAPPFSVTRNLGLVLAESRIAHAEDP